MPTLNFKMVPRILIAGVLAATALTAPATARPSTKGFVSHDYGCRYITQQVLATIANLPDNPTEADLRRAIAEIERLERAWDAAKCGRFSGSAIDFEAAEADLAGMMTGFENTDPAPAPPRFAVGGGQFNPPSASNGRQTVTQPGRFQSRQPQSRIGRHGRSN